MVNITPNPFTPQSGLEPRVLGGREGLIREFLHLLDKRREGNIFHLLLLGKWGMGKTSLLKFYKKIVQNKEFKAVYTSIPRTSKKDSSREVLYALMEEISFGLGIPRIEEGKTTHRNIALLMVDFLTRIFNSQSSQLLVVLIDDVQNISSLPQVLDILRLVLSNENLIKDTNYLFVLASTPEGWDNFLQKHDPIGRFFRTKQILRKLNYEELEATIKQTLNNTGVRFSEEIIARCWEYTEGHPYELQLLASHLYDNQEKGFVDENVWEPALLSTLKDLGIEFFASLYNRASEREKELLCIFAEKKKYLTLAQVREIMILERRAKSYPIANVKNFIYRLVDKNLLVRNSEDKKYRILDNMFAEYILRFR